MFLGIAISTVFFRYVVLPPYFEVSEMTGQEPVITFAGDLQVTRFSDRIYGISTRGKADTKIMIKHNPDQNIISEIEIMDNSSNSIDCVDMDSDGALDSWVFSTETDIYTYGRMSGYPDTVLIGDNEPLVRIDGEYYPFQKIDEKKFIEKDGELVELEYMPTRYFRIK